MRILHLTGIFSGLCVKGCIRKPFKKEVKQSKKLTSSSGLV